jgi:hypothetical protein
MTLGRQLVTDPALALVLPIKNLPPGTKRIRFRQRGCFLRFYCRFPGGIQECVGALNESRSEIELLKVGGAANYTREII